MAAPDAVASNIVALKKRIAQAAATAGRPADAIELVAVSKTYASADILAAIGAGQRLFGENRVQEAAEKFPALRVQHTLRLHLIGGLQTNKARDAVRIADVIESLDRPRLADALADAIQKEGRTPELLVQVNVGREPQKAGVAPEDADGLIAACRDRFGDALRGVMAIPPADRDPAPFFADLAARAARHGLPVVSMGMSGDFEAAILNGATRVRVGSLVFGPRSGSREPTGA